MEIIIAISVVGYLILALIGNQLYVALCMLGCCALCILSYLGYGALTLSIVVLLIVFYIKRDRSLEY